ncbi:MAG TPA: hypothetical protein VH207_14505, partial [Chthoniobacterales bacterium]|nr:hypothetical protein [Chthoniobacterales bacterium]
FRSRPAAAGSGSAREPGGPDRAFGFLADGTSRTEPDENTYLVLDHYPGGPTEVYEYGRHFLFQGHENSGDLPVWCWVSAL